MIDGCGTVHCWAVCCAMPKAEVCKCDGSKVGSFAYAVFNI